MSLVAPTTAATATQSPIVPSLIRRFRCRPQRRAARLRLTGPCWYRPDADDNNGYSQSARRWSLLAAGAIGFAVGAVIWKYRRGNSSKFGSFDRALDIARSGAVDTVQKLRKRLREEGYSPDQIEGRAKKYLTQVIEAVRERAY